MNTSLIALTFSLVFTTSLLANRAIQFREVDFTTSVIELHNFDTVTQALDGWRFCSHDDNQVRRYSSTSGLNGLSIPAGESLFLHFLNDAPAGDATAVNISSIGTFASPLDRGPFGLQLYNGGSFGNGNNIIDHLQWSIDGNDNTSADDRSDEAQSGGVWTNQSLWIATTTDTETITLTDTTGGILHSPSNYTATEPTAFPTTLSIDTPAISSNGDVTLTWADLSEFGPIQYIVEVSTTLTPDDWQAIPESPLAETTITLTDLDAGPRFYRVIAQLVPQ